ncbi:hypothetical protein N0V88_001558 [Collariella sp. IMI 366227]|nr:hypothetical protein N0V88_001558 [Collariella sp. IMI 366227]
MPAFWDFVPLLGESMAMFQLTPIAHSPTNRCFLVTLPLEILTNICQKVLEEHWNEDKSSLARLSQTCRTLYHVAIKELYTNIIDRIDGSVFWNLRPRYLEALPLRDTLVANANLATMVQSLKIQLPGLLSIARRLGGGEFPQYPVAIQRMFQIDPSLPNNLKEPLKVCFTRSLITNPGEGVNLHKLDGIFHSTPNIQRLIVNCARGGTSLTCRLPHITSLTLVNASLCARGIRYLLRNCRALATFIYTHDTTATVSSRFLTVSPSQLIECLLPFCTTLRSLHISPWVDLHEIRHRPIPYRFIYSLGQFTALQHLAVNYRAISDRGQRRKHRELIQNNQRDKIPRYEYWLVDCLDGLQNLETAYFFGLPESAFEQEYFEMLTWAIVDMAMWPRLKTIWFEFAGPRPPPPPFRSPLPQVVPMVPEMVGVEGQEEEEARDAFLECDVKLRRAGVWVTPGYEGEFNRYWAV